MESHIAIVGRSIWAIESGPLDKPQQVAAVLPTADVLRAIADHQERGRAHALPAERPIPTPEDRPELAGMAASEGTIGLGDCKAAHRPKPKKPKGQPAPKLTATGAAVVRELRQAGAFDREHALTRADLAQRIGASRDYLRRELPKLCMHGVIASARGQLGGYWLAD